MQKLKRKHSRASITSTTSVDTTSVTAESVKSNSEVSVQSDEVANFEQVVEVEKVCHEIEKDVFTDFKRTE